MNQWISFDELWEKLLDDDYYGSLTPEDEETLVWERLSLEGLELPASETEIAQVVLVHIWIALDGLPLYHKDKDGRYVCFENTKADHINMVFEYDFAGNPGLKGCAINVLELREFVSRNNYPLPRFLSDVDESTEGNGEGRAEELEQGHQEQAGTDNPFFIEVEPDTEWKHVYLELLTKWERIHVKVNGERKYTTFKQLGLTKGKEDVLSRLGEIFELLPKIQENDVYDLRSILQEAFPQTDTKKSISSLRKILRKAFPGAKGDPFPAKEGYLPVFRITKNEQYDD